MVVGCSDSTDTETAVALGRNPVEMDFRHMLSEQALQRSAARMVADRRQASFLELDWSWLVA